MSEATQREHQLVRLTRIVDVVFALAIWRIFQLMPRASDNPAWTSVAELLRANWDSFAVTILATLIVIIYWQQQNEITRYLVATDAKHSALSIFQVVFLLIFLYAIGAGLELGASPAQRAFESTATMVVGVFSNLSWRYAISRDGLLDSSAPADKVKGVTQKIMAEPLTAAITIPFAFVGPWMWEISWFLYPLIRGLLRRHRSRNDSR